MIDHEWRVLTGAGLSEVAALAARCLAVHGGLPLAAEPSFLQRRFAARAVTARDPAGRLIAAAGLRDDDGGGGPVAAWLALPEAVDHAGAAVLDAALAAGAVRVETEFLTVAAERLFARRALVPDRAEDVLRFDRRHGISAAALPAGITLREWSTGLAPRFHAVYAAAFRDRPGFPGWDVTQWTRWLVDDDFRPQASLLATGADGTDAGFVTSAAGWIVQVGVRPGWRGRGLGAALVCAALRRHDADAVLLDVAVGNPAVRLYRRLGFDPLGRRGTYRVA
ncbi:GNAT family N-acetyltransferase [Spirilliplanes yamanashiensis]|uniref:N-acetyltransferase domain-containing protein n=1 Tax=Spirilliplanes yamanashiensis TaxID=42233 RepID=A0A8J3Y8R1_9ACTN|nr:GNAT family N-acetyltransferase [Spirilliplanes yamanashiensis]MDP9817051.1 ribosomal protein S18 acetylase RimI-like enzyme [Spirilliplanes yamanashiensis]GIJ03293.1 hypothetical protein Sya03_26450 [Spirilliplanes yamanashiensis]